MGLQGDRKRRHVRLQVCLRSVFKLISDRLSISRFASLGRLGRGLGNRRRQQDSGGVSALGFATFWRRKCVQKREEFAESTE